MNSFTDSILTALRQWRWALLVWCVQLVLALPPGLQFFDVLKASIGDSLSVEGLRHDYDHTVLSDFLKIHGGSVSPLLGQLLFLWGVWWICSVFLKGGLLGAVVSGNSRNAKQFWSDAATHFFPFLKWGLLFALLFLLWTVALWWPFLLSFESLLLRLNTEQTLLVFFAGVLFLYAAGCIILYAWHLAVLLLIVTHKGPSPSPSLLKRALRLFWNRQSVFIRNVLLYLALLFLLFLLHRLVEIKFPSDTPLCLGMLFLLQQMFLWSHLIIRQALYHVLARWIIRDESHRAKP